MSLSFSWGFSPKSDDATSKEAFHQMQQQQQQQDEQLQLLQQQLQQRLTKQKRRHTDEDSSSDSGSPSRPQRPKKSLERYRVGKSTSTTQTSSMPAPQLPHKRSRAHISRIQGQPLNTQRLLEVLDKPQLEQLIGQLCHLHPELTLDITRCAPKPSVSSAISVLQSKVNKINSSLPYKVDPASEYAYLRVKPRVQDFLSALSDYTLSFLPPVETVPLTSLEFLDSATGFLHQLPQFAQESNNYYKNLAYEQLGHTWCACIKEIMCNSHSGVMSFVNNNWEAKIVKHNELANGKLQHVVDLYKEELRLVYELDNVDQEIKKNFSGPNSPFSLKS